MAREPSCETLFELQVQGLAKRKYNDDNIKTELIKQCFDSDAFLDTHLPWCTFTSFSSWTRWKNKYWWNDVPRCGSMIWVFLSDWEKLRVWVAFLAWFQMLALSYLLNGLNSSLDLFSECLTLNCDFSLRKPSFQNQREGAGEMKSHWVMKVTVGSLLKESAPYLVFYERMLSKLYCKTLFLFLVMKPYIVLKR